MGRQGSVGETAVEGRSVILAGADVERPSIWGKAKHLIFYGFGRIDLNGKRHYTSPLSLNLKATVSMDRLLQLALRSLRLA